VTYSLPPMRRLMILPSTVNRCSFSTTPLERKIGLYLGTSGQWSDPVSARQRSVSGRAPSGEPSGYDLRVFCFHCFLLLWKKLCFNKFSFILFPFLNHHFALLFSFFSSIRSPGDCLEIIFIPPSSQSRVWILSAPPQQGYLRCVYLFVSFLPS